MAFLFTTPALVVESLPRGASSQIWNLVCLLALRGFDAVRTGALISVVNSTAAVVLKILSSSYLKLVDLTRLGSVGQGLSRKILRSIVQELSVVREKARVIWCEV